MIGVLLDTDHVSLQERGHFPLRARLASLSSGAIAVSVVTAEEMLRGRLAILARRSEGEARVRAYAKFLETVLFFSSVPVIPSPPVGRLWWAVPTTGLMILRSD